jgi:menaquinone-dependent protoporphyrinogen oxidase
MTPTALVLHASREGQSEKIALRAAAHFAGRGFTIEVASALAGGSTWSRANLVLLVASVHLGHHSRKLERLVAARRDELERQPSALLSVSLSAAGQEPEHLADAARMLDSFLANTGWQPTIAEPCAGALRYTRYPWLKRFVMKRIAEKARGATDTSCDHEYTDWVQVDRVVDELASTALVPA